MNLFRSFISRSLGRINDDCADLKAVCCWLAHSMEPTKGLINTSDEEGWCAGPLEVPASE